MDTRDEIKDICNEMAELRELAQREFTKLQLWGGLNRVLTKEGHYLWLCKHHADEYKE